MCGAVGRESDDMKDHNARALSMYGKGDPLDAVEEYDDGQRERWWHNDLDAMGVVGLRQTDLRDVNVACCGDCRHSGAITAADANADFTCAQQYTTSLYSVRALRCAHFELRPCLSDVPQPDERTNHDRRQIRLPVLRERRDGSERRRLGLEMS